MAVDTGWLAGDNINISSIAAEYGWSKKKPRYLNVLLRPKLYPRDISIQGIEVSFFELFDPATL